MEFVCNMCRIAAPNYQNWLLHLTTEEHQSNMHESIGPDLYQSELMQPYLRDKVILVSGILTNVPLIDVASYFSEWGLIRNIVYNGTVVDTTMQCLVIYDSQTAVDQVQSFQKDEGVLLWGSKLNVQKIYETENEVFDIHDDDILYDNHHEQNEQVFSIPSSTPSPLPASVVHMDLSEFETSKQINTFENINEYQKIAIQMKEDLSDLKLEEQVDAFCQLLCLTGEQIKRRFELGNDLLTILQQKFPECAIYPFGHDYIGIASDIDTMNLVIDPFGKMGVAEDCASTHSIISSPDSQTIIAGEILELLKKEQYKLKFCSDVEMKRLPWAYSESKIQKISFIHRSSHVLCNLVIENYMIVQECRLVKFMSSLDPRAHPLLCLVRFFASVYDILHTSSEAFKNHSVIWLLLHFLSSKKILPTVNELHSLHGASLIMENIDVSFCNNKEIVKPNNTPFMDEPSIRSFSVLSLLKEFFEFFASADLKRSVVCPVVGKLVPVRAFGKTINTLFPEEIRGRYLMNADGSTRERRFYSGSPMGLQNPLDLTTNLTKDSLEADVTRFQNIANKAAEKLSQILESGSGEIVELFTDLFNKISIPNKVDNKKLTTTKEIDNRSDKSSSVEVQSEDDIVVTKEPEPKEESSWEMDTEEEDEMKDVGYQEIKKGKVRVNQSLRLYFQNAVNMTLSTEDLKELSPELRKKFQVLWFEYVVEFNSLFWKECFGFLLETYAHDKLTSEAFAKTDDNSYTLKERLNLIKTDLELLSLEFRCETDEKISELLYKKKVWKKNYLQSHLRALWAILTSDLKGIALNSEFENAKKMVHLPFTRKMEFSCKLDLTFDLREEDEIPSNGDIEASVKVQLNDESYYGTGKFMRVKKLRFLTSVYEKLAMKYCNLRIKQWLASCKDFQYLQFNVEYKKHKLKQKGHPKWRKFKGSGKRLGKCL